MSETAERETEVVVGTIKGVIVKGVDKWQIEVQPEGLEYTKKLWTKDKELVAAMPAKIGQHGGFVCHASYWDRDGTPTRSLWVAEEAAEDAEPGVSGVPPQATTTGNGSPDTAPSTAAGRQAAPSGNVRVYSPDLKDRMIVRQTALKAAAEIVGPRAGSTLDPDYDAALETMKAAQRFETWVYRDIDPVPFAPELSEHDDSIPF